MKPKEFLTTYVKKFNAGDISSLLTLYETDASFIVQQGQVVNGLENIRQALQTLVDVNGKLETKVKGVIQTSEIALVNSEWSFNGSGPGGKSVTITCNTIDVLRQQSDGSWKILIDNSWGTDLQMRI